MYEKTDETISGSMFSLPSPPHPLCQIELPKNVHVPSPAIDGWGIISSTSEGVAKYVQRPA